MNSTRRQFLQHLALASGTGALLPAHSKAATEESAASFFLVGDTHYCADAEDISKMDAISADYNSRLSSITGGQGSYSLDFSHYEVVPGNLQQQIVDAHKKEVIAAHA